MDTNIVSLDAQNLVLIRLAKLLPLICITSQFSGSFVSASTQLHLKVTFQTKMNPNLERGGLRRTETTFCVPHKFTAFCQAHNLGSQTPQIVELKTLTIH